MPIQYINTGSSANAGNGDTLRTAFTKINNNFAILSTATYSGGSMGPTGPTGPTGPSDFTSIASHVLPATDLGYDLGSTSSQWRSLYVGTNTIYLGGTAVSISGGNLTIDGEPAVGGVNLGDRITSSTYSVILEGTTGTISVPNSIISQGYQLNLAGSQNSYDIGRYLRIRDGDYESHLHLDTPDNSLYDIILGDDGKFVRVDHTGMIVIGTSGLNSHSWSFGDDGNLTLPGNVNSVDSINIVAGDSVRIISNSTVDAKTWYFDETGTITVPGGIKTALGSDLSIETESLPTDPPATIVINGADFVSVNLTYIKDGANSIWYPAGYIPGTDPYIEFTGGQYGIFVPEFGQALYVNTGTLNVPLEQWNINPPLGSVAPTGVYTYPSTYNHNWQFGIDGGLTFPNGTIQTTAYGFVTPPISSTSTGIAGSLAQDASYFYVCTATNAWQRISWDNTPW